MRRILVVLVVVVVIDVIVLLTLRGSGISARRTAWPLEAPVSRAAWKWLVPESTRAATNPVAAGADVLQGAREHWADHCSTCHGNDGSGDTTIGRRVFPPTPDMRKSTTQSLTDGELFYAIEQGIPWTAMPGWTTSTDEGAEESWALVRFIRHLPAITPDEIDEMRRLNPAPPPKPDREKEIEDFLNG